MMWAGNDAVDIPAPAPRANQPLAPIENLRLRPLPARLVSGVRFASVAASFAPDREPEVGAAAEPSVMGGLRLT